MATMADLNTAQFTGPRRPFIRTLLKQLAAAAFAVLTDLHIVGRENFPEQGPLLAVANHFSFIDPVLMLHISPWTVEFVGGMQQPNSPPIVRWIPKLWGYYRVPRGAASRDGLRAAESLLAQGGVIGIYPEGGNWATVLRPARPGAAFLAVRTGARILPMGFDGLTEIFPNLRRGRRTRVVAQIGRPFGPFQVTGHGRERRRQLDEIGHEIMRRIAELIPPERRGHYSDDPAIRAAAQGTELYPWDAEPEEL